ncbi:hypothetical protein PENSTE_c005G02809 [Penicillium steckii]|uniref:Metallo-beta-lactamase domain-containing protein n=1 Tax=Penicillium steckii TaxID=303698 RepID=A0A1V6TLE8_9EURO|nr:hypothetical protein PENSTE_c005G02809 [Penicillium steckii]
MSRDSRHVILAQISCPSPSNIFPSRINNINQDRPEKMIDKIDEDLLVCSACGTQFDTDDRAELSECYICKDPRQFIPPSGQAFSTLRTLKENSYRNEWRTIHENHQTGNHLYSIVTKPKFGIGQRAFLLKTPHGNILWDLIAFIDSETIEKIQSLGGLTGIVISHPHYYTTYVTWARHFKCPVYVSIEDMSWMTRQIVSDVDRHLIRESYATIIPGITAIKCGGHFPGSLVLHWTEDHGILFIADTIVTVPSGLNPSPRHSDQSTYTFMWSIPNMIPMSVDDIHQIWTRIKPYNFKRTFGAFEGLEVSPATIIDGDSKFEEFGLKKRLLDSMKIVAKQQSGGFEGHALFKESA